MTARQPPPTANARYARNMEPNSLKDIAAALIAPGKGILAADESPRTIGSRFDSVGVENTETNRRDYRETLFSADGLERFISGVILHGETLRQNCADGFPIVEFLIERGITPGVKVDAGAHPLAGAPGETITEGLDGLRERLAECASLGARFAKWRAVLTIGENIPSARCIEANAHALARYAALAQEAGLVPIVEPEVMLDGDHSIDRCAEVTERALREVYAQLARQGVSLEGTLLKPNMAVSGKDAPNRAGSREAAEKTVAALMRSVPAAVPGIAFLSGGQSDEESTANLNAIVRRGWEVGAPWELTFSFARGLQSAPLAAWAGRAENVARAQASLLKRAALTAAARRGEYRPDMSAADA